MTQQSERKTKRARRGRGEGGIRERTVTRKMKDGTTREYTFWVAEVRYGAGQKRKSISCKTKKEAQDKLREAQNAGPAASGDKMTVGQFIDQWMESTAKRSLRPSTWRRYEQLVRIRITPYVGNVPLAKLSPMHGERFLVDLDKAGVSARGQQMAVNVLGRAMKDAVRLRLIPSNPIRDVVKPKTAKKKMRVWDAEQVKTFLATAEAEDIRMYALYVVAIATGMRSGELFGLEWSDIDLEGRSVFVQRSIEEIGGKLEVQPLKTEKSRRRIDLPLRAVQALREHRERMQKEATGAGREVSSVVFCDEDGGRLRRPNVTQRSFRPLIKAVDGLPQIRFHDLRHTAATLLLLANVHPKIVSERLGHASVELTLNTYSHCLPTMQQSAADKLDAMFGVNGGTMAENEASD
jgi:integrase